MQITQRLRCSQAQIRFWDRCAYRFRQYLVLSVMIRALVDPVKLVLLCCPERIETLVPRHRRDLRRSQPHTVQNGYQS